MILEIVGNVADIAGALGGLTAAWGVLRMLAAQRRASECVEVALWLEGKGRSVHLPLELRRRDVSRAELLGRIGMLPMRQKGARFSLRALAEPAFMARLNDVVEGETSTLIIPCSNEELEQFDIHN